MKISEQKKKKKNKRNQNCKEERRQFLTPLIPQTEKLRVHNLLQS